MFGGRFRSVLIYDFNICLTTLNSCLFWSELEQYSFGDMVNQECSNREFKVFCKQIENTFIKECRIQLINAR